MSQKYLLIALGIVSIVGLFYIIFSATQNSEISPISPSTPTFQPKTAKMMAPVKDKPVTGQIIVQFKPQYTATEINQDLRQYRAAIKSTIEGINQTVVKVPQGQEESIMQKLKNDPYVQQVQRDYTTHAFVVPNDPHFALQYAFNNTGQAILGQSGKAKADINAETAWNTTEGNGVKVAILDTGINLNQPDLAGKVILQKSFVTGVTSVEDGNGHGTHVAGILAADTNNGIGVAGTCPGCQLLIGKVLDDSGSGTTSESTAGITWAADNGAKVISLSLGTTEANTASLYNQAVSYALSKGAIVVAAAGNDGITQLNYPAAATGVVSVAATTNTDAKASYSNFGNWVEIAAPGDNILSTGPTHSFQLEPFGYTTSSPYYYLSGTSMATPIVSGVAALIASTSFGTTPQAIISRLYSTADKITGTGTDWIHGRVDAVAAVGQAAATPTPTPTPKGSLITPTLFCVGGTGKPPCATLPPTAPTNAPNNVGGNANPSTTPSSEVSQGVSGSPSPSISNSPSVSPIAIGAPGTVLPCPSQNQTSSFSNDSGASATTISSHGRHWKIHRHQSGFMSQFFKFLLQLLLQLIQLIGINPCGTSGTPTVTPTPEQPSNSPSQGVSTVPPVSSSPSSGASNPTTAPGLPTSSAPTSATAPTSAAGGFTIAPVGTALPRSDSLCASEIRTMPERIPENATANATKGPANLSSLWGPWTKGSTGLEDNFSHVDGNFTGTTDEILEWAACKWGWDENYARAEAVIESSWHQSEVGDNSESYGILQVKASPSGPASANTGWGGYPWTQNSTAVDADAQMAYLRACYDGKLTYFGNGYTSGNAWNCIGTWFSGAWPGDTGYISQVQNSLSTQAWLNQH